MHVVKPHIQVRVGLHDLAIEKRLEIFCQDRSTATSDDHGIDIPVINPETINFIGDRCRQLAENLICQTFKIVDLASDLDTAFINRFIKTVEFNIDSAVLTQLGRNHIESPGNTRIRGAATSFGIAHLVRDGVIGGAETDIDDTDFILDQTLVTHFTKVIEHHVEKRTKGLRYNAHLVDAERLLVLLTVGINHGYLVLADKELGQLILVLPVIADRQTGHQVNGDKAFNHLSRSRQGKDLGKLPYELGLVESKETYITLPLSKFTDKIRFTVDLDLQMFFIFTRCSDQLVAKLDICRFTQNRFKNQVTFAICRLRKTEADINSQSFHSFLLLQGAPNHNHRPPGGWHKRLLTIGNHKLGCKR